MIDGVLKVDTPYSSTEGLIQVQDSVIEQSNFYFFNKSQYFIYFQ